jgi:hypothetical protein
MKNLIKIAALSIVAATSACTTPSVSANNTVAAAQTKSAPEPSKRWIGVMAVKESPLVNQVLAETNYVPAAYYPKLRTLLDAGAIAAAPGNYAFVPYAGGKPTEQPERFKTTTGVYTMWVPAEMVSPGRAMCVQVPASWPAIAGQKRYPSTGGKHVNCFDFGANAIGDYATTKYTASMIVVIEPAG